MSRRANLSVDEIYECPQGVDPKERKKLLYKVVDGQASEEEEKYFYTTLEKCSHCQCRDICNDHLEIKNLLKEKIINKPLPNGLIEEIKTKILKS